MFSFFPDFCCGFVAATQMTPSSTADSLAEAPIKNYTPSMTSSGYGSQAVSTLTLSSEDSLSIKSIEDQSEAGTRHVQLGGHKAEGAEVSVDSEADEHVGDVVGCLAKEALNEETEEEEYGDEGDDETKARNNESGQSLADGGDSSLKTSPPHVTTATAAAASGADRAWSNSDVDSDPYSITAMDELEKLGMVEEEEEGADGVQRGGERNAAAAANGRNSAQRQQPPAAHVTNHPVVEVTAAADLHPKHQEGGTKRVVGKRKGLGIRPKSMVVSPQAEKITKAWLDTQEDLHHRHSLHLSDDALIGEYCTTSMISLGFWKESL